MCRSFVIRPEYGLIRSGYGGWQGFVCKGFIVRGIFWQLPYCCRLVLISGWYTTSAGLNDRKDRCRLRIGNKPKRHSGIRDPIRSPADRGLRWRPPSPGYTLGRREGGNRIRGNLSPAQKGPRAFPAGSPRAEHERGLPVPQCLDPARTRRKTAGHGLLLRRGIHGR